MRLITRESAALQGRKVVSYQAADGETYDFEIRRLGADELIATGVIPADSMMDDQDVAAAVKVLTKKGVKEVEKQAAAKAIDKVAGTQARKLLAEDIASKVDGVILRGLLAPLPWAGADESIPDGAIPLRDLGQFRDRLFKDIVGFSTASKEAAEAVRFRDSQRPGRGVRGARREGGLSPNGPVA